MVGNARRSGRTTGSRRRQAGHTPLSSNFSDLCLSEVFFPCSMLHFFFFLEVSIDRENKPVLLQIQRGSV